MPQQKPSPPSWRTPYLTTYNLLLCALWTLVLALTLHHAPSGPHAVFRTVAPLARWTQTLSILDILHAATGLIPSPLGTTFTQVFTRVVQVWAIWFAFPATTAGEWAFVALVGAWGAADAVRYMYLALKMHGLEGRAVTWVRYSMFWVLYPVGIAAEWWLMYRAAGPVGEVSVVLRGVFWFLLALYVPGAYVMFSHMVRQRRKVLGKGKRA